MLTDNYSNNIKFVGVGRASDKALVAAVAPIKGDVIETYLTAVKEVLSAPDFMKKVTPGARYRLGGELNCFNFTVDQEGRVYIVISTQDYPERLVFQMINQLVIKFKEFGPTSLTCPPNGLDKVAKRMLTDLAKEYDDPTKVDKLEQVKRQVEQVKGTMHQNLGGMLKNIDLAENIDDGANQLKEQAAHFQQQANQLKWNERMRAWKIYCGMFLVLVILIVVIVLSLFGPQIATAAAGTPTIPPPPSASTPGSAPTPAAGGPP